MLWYLQIFVLAICLISHSTFSTIVKPCKSGAQIPDDKISLTNCVQPPCEFKRDSTVFIEMLFTPETKVEKLSNNAFALALGMKTPYPGMDGKNACPFIYLPDDSKADCPLEPGQEYKYKIPLPVKKSYPKVSGVLHWGLKEKGSDPIVCFEVDIAIV